MALVSLLTLRTECRSQCDMVNSTFVTDAEFNQYIRNAYSSLYGKIVTAFSNDYFVQTPAAGYTFTTDGVNQLFALPTSTGEQLMFKLLGVDVQALGAPSQWISLKPFAFADRNRTAYPNSQIPQAGQTVRVLYIPLPTLPTADGDTVEGVNSWEEWIVIEASIVALAKEESDISAFVARRQQMQQRLDDEIENRNASESGEKIVDVANRAAAGMQYRLNGNNLWLIGGTPIIPGYNFGDWDSDWAGGGYW